MAFFVFITQGVFKTNMENRYAIIIINYKNFINLVRQEIGTQLQLSPAFCYKNALINYHKDYWELIYYQIGENDKNKIVEIAKAFGKCSIEIEKIK